MNKKVPKVFANSVSSDGNNKGVFYSVYDNVDNSIISEDRNVNQKIMEIFNSSSYVYKAEVEITLKDGVVSKKIIGKNSTHLITMDNELIPISEILDISKK